ncbi:unnamed protein product [Oppiella nova]|uniref:Uncharacterized protein n=1 Tax=Oppiella nova TaxID=334625 RepID=A0A7R9M7C4_9ACAR|nr:unnamed protein product [Oppiella nova]CAG2172009.1 unnamed protein product [Oppiella nova]
MFSKSLAFYLCLTIGVTIHVSLQDTPDMPPIVAACFDKIYPLTMQCVTQAYMDWNMTYNWEAPVYYDPKGQQACCSGWQAFDCYESGPVKKCNSSEQIAVKKFIADTVDYECKHDCIHYTYHSKQCDK